MYRYASASKTNSFRNDDGRALTTYQIADYAPSVLATEPHESRGDRYAYIPTFKVLDAMKSQGFHPFEVRQTKVRDHGRREHTKHMVRLRHESSMRQNGGEFQEIILINSHDGTSSYQLMAGFFRMVCSNGLIAGDINTDVRVRHTGDVVNDVIEGSFEVLKNMQEIEHRKESFKAIELLPREQLILAEQAQAIRWGDDAPVAADKLLRPRRREDVAPTLWNTYNKIQENLLKGGVGGRSATGRRISTRAVQGVSENVKLNRALWALTEKMAELKAA